jgi:CheY-specific phosphatase CheX
VSSPSRNLLEKLLAQKDLLKIIVSALSESISGYTRLPVSVGKPLLNGEEKPKAVAVAGFLRLEGEAGFSMELSLGFSKELFLVLYENMFQMPIDEISQENEDLAGEILNIAFGAMDPRFRELGYHMKSSFPEVYSGKKLKDYLGSIVTSSIRIPYTAAEQSFFVELYLAGSLQQDWKFDSEKKCG